jgi:hypothetical protein
MRRLSVIVASVHDSVNFAYMRISLEIPEGGAAGFMVRKLEEIAGMPPEEYAREAIERAAERDLAEIYRLLLARVAKLPDAPEEAN